MKRNDYDFSGYATRHNIKCADGRTIRSGAFKDQDGMEIPLCWNHEHDDPGKVLGHAVLESRKDGMYAYCYLNDSDAGRSAKEDVMHGDICSLSIYANKLQETSNRDVLHGIIREVSLVIAGANPGAVIDNVVEHNAEDGESAWIYSGENISLYHSSEETEEDHNKDKESNGMAEGKSLQEIYDGMTDEQKGAVDEIVEAAVNDVLSELEDDEDENEEGEDDEMGHNVFDSDAQDDVLMHDAMNNILADGKRYGSLKESYLAHADEYGIKNIEYLEPDDKDIYQAPPFINTNPIGWVTKVINGVHHTPFAKIRMVFADITADEARARGYIKGKYKKEEVIKLLKRSIGPTTIYKKQKFDKDDLVDIDFDAVPWIKKEMLMKLDEEKARAYIFGDGRNIADDDKVKEDCIIPVVADEDLFTIKVEVTPEQGQSVAEAIIDTSLIAQDDYQGSGNTTCFMEAKQVTRMLLLKDQFGHRLYKDVNELANAMGVGEIIKVPAGIVPQGIYGVILDLSDYNVGQKDAGKKQMFDDFDIDYNQQKFLIEERQSAGLTRPYSAIVLKVAANG